MNSLTTLLLLAATITAQSSPQCTSMCQNQISPPVCGINGVTYRSLCELNCNGISFAYNGGCTSGPVTNPGDGSTGGSTGGSTVPSEGPIRCVNQCLGQFHLVCGSDYVTYKSECHLKCTNSAFYVLNEGYCAGNGGSGPIFGGGNPPPTNPPPTTGCSCTTDFSPVCGADGITYSNACFAACAGTSVAYLSVCQNCSAACPTYISYVCGSNGVTYQNQCFLVCQGGVNLASYGKCA